MLLFRLITFPYSKKLDFSVLRNNWLIDQYNPATQLIIWRSIKQNNRLIVINRLIAHHTTRRQRRFDSVRLSFLWQSFVYMFEKFSEHNRRRSKMVEADTIRQKFQMRFEFPNRNRVTNDDITNHSKIVFESCCVKGAYAYSQFKPAFHSSF